MESVGSAEAAPGEIATGRLPVGETRDGSELALPVAVVNGVDPGETLYLQAASDGDELNGVGVIRRFVQTVDPETLSGCVLIVGIANLPGFRAASHRNPIDNTKLNRAYPGSETGSSSERIAAATFDVATRADRILDLHQGSTSKMVTETRIRCGRRHSLHNECQELARVFGCPYILDKKGPDGQLARAGPDEGVPAVDPELGGCVGMDGSSIEVGLEGIRNVLCHYGQLPGTVTPIEQTKAGDFEQYNAPVGGLIDPVVSLGETVDAGEPLFHVTDVFGRTRDTVRTKKRGLYWRQRRLPQVASGEYVCTLGVELESLPATL